MKLKLYVVIVDNGNSYEDYEERVFGIFDTAEKAERYGKLDINEKRQSIYEKMYENDDYGYDMEECNEWGYRVEIKELNEGL